MLIYGERGVGKTSLANVLEAFLTPAGKNQVIAPHQLRRQRRFHHHRRDLQRFPLIQEKAGFGWRRDRRFASALGDELTGAITPDAVLSISHELTRKHRFIPIIDEFDRLGKPEVATVHRYDQGAVGPIPFDHADLVGINDTVEKLIAGRNRWSALAAMRMPPARAV